jgi:signal transduction histidine kinase
VRRLAEDLRDVAGGISGHMSVNREHYVTLAPLVEGVIEAFVPAAAHKEITLVGKLEKDSGPADVDADRLQQIVSNLLSNAIRYTPVGGRIEVHCGRRDDHVELLVRDTGKGIAADALPRVFERYWQGQPALDAESGLGLGLSICRMLVEQHQGKIEVMSEGEGQGATFIVRFPLAADTSGKKSKRRNTPLPTRIKDAAFATARVAGRQVSRPFRTGS